ncbi:MAG: protein PhnA [Crocinitomicaceae bacterium]|jgi:protein PhnA
MNIEIYGAEWCKDTNRVIAQLKERDFSYTLYAIDDKDHGQEYTQKVMEINNGKRITPTLVIYDENYSNPTKQELENLMSNPPGEEGITKCSNGKILDDGDTVLLTRDLDVKGSSLNLKQGTALEKIKLTGDPAYIDCRIGKSTLAIKTEFVKKKG